MTWLGGDNTEGIRCLTISQRFAQEQPELTSLPELTVAARSSAREGLVKRSGNCGQRRGWSDSLPPLQADRLVQCQGFTPDSAATDYTPLHCLHRKWLMDRCLDGKPTWFQPDAEPPTPLPPNRPPR